MPQLKKGKTMNITNFQKRILRWICRKLVVQGPNHQGNITEYYKIMVEAAKDQFREDNDPTLQHFLEECQTNAFNSTKKYYCKICSHEIPKPKGIEQN